MQQISETIVWGCCWERHRIIWVDLLQYASTQCNLNTRQYSLQYRQTQTMHTTAKLKTVFWRRIAHGCDAGTKVLAQPGAHLSNDYNYAQKQLLTSSIFRLDRYCNFATPAQGCGLSLNFRALKSLRHL